MGQRLAKRLLIVGWDAADWKLIEALFGHGRMPNLQRLVDTGARGDLATLHPALSPLLWTSIATGKTADKHGVLNFIEPDPAAGGLRVSMSTTRRVKALWNILTQSGLRTNVISWYASHPAEPINGVCVSNLFQEGMPPGPDDPWPLLDHCVHPHAWRDRVGELRMHAAELRPEELLGLVPGLGGVDRRDPRPGVLAKYLAQAASVHNVATALLEESEWDCTMVFYETIDVIGHHFMQYHPPRMGHVPERDFEVYRHVMLGVYQIMDMMLGRLLELAGEETTVLLLSDHGFHSDHLRPRVQAALNDPHAAMDASWHRPLGVLAMAGPGVKSGERVYGANLLDIAPTALTLLGVPVGGDMDGRVLIEALDPAPEIERVFGWEAMEGEAGQHPADLRIDPFDAQAAMAQLAELGYVQGAESGAAEQIERLRLETRFNLAVVYMTTRRVTEALPIFEELARERPDEPRYVLNLVQCLIDRGRHAEARKVLEGFVERHPDLRDAKIYLGMALFAEGKFTEAGEVLEAAERQGDTSPELNCLLGVVYVSLKRLEDAERVFRRAVHVDPHQAKAHHGLALVDLNAERFSDAVEHCLDAVGLQHFFPDAHHTLGSALTWMRDYEHAIKAFEVAISMQPGLIDSHRFLASIYRHLGRPMDAARHRDIARRLMDDRRAGRTSLEAGIREVPMGPQEWADRVEGA